MISFSGPVSSNWMQMSLLHLNFSQLALQRTIWALHWALKVHFLNNSIFKSTIFSRIYVFHEKSMKWCTILSEFKIKPIHPSDHACFCDIKFKTKCYC